MRHREITGYIFIDAHYPSPNQAQGRQMQASDLAYEKARRAKTQQHGLSRWRKTDSSTITLTALFLFVCAISNSAFSAIAIEGKNSNCSGSESPYVDCNNQIDRVVITGSSSKPVNIQPLPGDSRNYGGELGLEGAGGSGFTLPPIQSPVSSSNTEIDGCSSTANPVVIA
jgi:hypothetical protein